MKRMPMVMDAVARWDADTQKVRYYAVLENKKEVEINARMFSSLSHSMLAPAVASITAVLNGVGDNARRMIETLTEFEQQTRVIRPARNKATEN
jgi:hypothetical protein